MTHYVLVDSRDPGEYGDGHWYRRLASDLKSRGHEVSLFLVENGVFAARRRAGSGVLDPVKKAGVSVRADEFALRERGIDGNDLAPGITSAPLDFIIERMAGGANVMWR